MFTYENKHWLIFKTFRHHWIRHRHLIQLGTQLGLISYCDVQIVKSNGNKIKLISKFLRVNIGQFLSIVNIIAIGSYGLTNIWNRRVGKLNLHFYEQLVVVGELAGFDFAVCWMAGWTVAVVAHWQLVACFLPWCMLYWSQ